MEERSASMRLTSPRVLHGLPGGAAVDVDDEGNFLVGVCITRQNQVAVENRAIVGFELQSLGRDQVVGGDAVALPYRLAGVADGAHGNSRRSQGCGVRLDEVFAIVVENRGIVSVA